VICAVNGIAAGAVPTSRSPAILVFAARSASFLQAFARIGLVPTRAAHGRLPRLVGPARARGLAMLAEPLPAEKAEAWGLIWKAVDDDKLEAEVAAVAGRLAGAATYGWRLIQRALAQSSTNTSPIAARSGARPAALAAPRPTPPRLRPRPASRRSAPDDVTVDVARDTASMWPATAATSASSLSSSTAFQMRPQASAFSRKRLGQHGDPRARAGPTRRGRVHVPLASGTRPILAKACRKLALRAANTISQASATLHRPGGNALTAQITGFSSVAMSRTSGL